MQVGQPARILPWNTTLPGDIGGTSTSAAAIWYDNTQQLCIALMMRLENAVPPTLSEQVEYRVFSMTASINLNVDNHSSSAPDLDSVVQPHRILRFRLPPTLATERHRAPPPSSTRTENQAHPILVRRIPLDVKLSLDQRLLVIQFHATLLRIVPLERLEDESFSSTPQNHWTIDFSTGSIDPVSTGPFSVPPFGNSSDTAKPSKELEDNNHTSVTTTTEHKREWEILTNGIIFSDHGGNSQDLIVVTTKAVVCYKISLQRNKMAVAHSFPHSPSACAVWYDPPTRSVVVGSIGRAVDCSNVAKDGRSSSSSSISNEMTRLSSITTVQLRTFLLRFPNIKKPTKMGLPRLELPPPRRLPLYAAGRSRIFCVVTSMPTVQPIITAPIITPTELWLVNIYGDAYIIEMESSASLGFQLVLHRVHSTLGVVYFKTYTIEDLRTTQVKTQRVLISVLDNVLFVSFPDVMLFLDILDTENTYYLEETPDAVATMVDRQRATFMPPRLILDRSGHHHQVIPVVLGIGKLAKSLPWAPSIVPFFLRRESSPKSHEIAVSKLEVLVTRDAPSDHGSVLKLQEIRRTMDMLVQMYAVDNPGSFRRDWNIGLSLLYESALLPVDAVFRNHSVDAMITSRNMGRKVKRPRQSTNVLYESEILGKILIPNAKAALKDDERSRIRQVLDIAISMLGALDRCQRPSSPALECFIFSILWHLGYEQELVCFLESRCRSNAHRKTSSSGLLCMNVFPWDVGNIVLANLMVAIASEISFGTLQTNHSTTTSDLVRNYHGIWKPQNCKIQGMVKKWSSRLLLIRVTSVKLAATHLLREGRILEAMNLCLRCERFGSKTNDRSDRGQKHASHLPEIDLATLDDRQMDAMNFVFIALSSCKQEHPAADRGDHCRILSCLKAFLLRQESDPIGKSKEIFLFNNLFTCKHQEVGSADDASVGVMPLAMPAQSRCFYPRRHSFQSEAVYLKIV